MFILDFKLDGLPFRAYQKQIWVYLGIKNKYIQNFLLLIWQIKLETKKINGSSGFFLLCHNTILQSISCGFLFTRVRWMMSIHVFYTCAAYQVQLPNYSLSSSTVWEWETERKSRAVLCRNLALLCNVEGNQGNGRPPDRCQTTLSNTKQQEGQLRTRDFSQNNTHRDGKKTEERLGQIEKSGKY